MFTAYKPFLINVLYIHVKTGKAWSLKFFFAVYGASALNNPVMIAKVYVSLYISKSIRLFQLMVMTNMNNCRQEF